MQGVELFETTAVEIGENVVAQQVNETTRKEGDLGRGESSIWRSSVAAIRTSSTDLPATLHAAGLQWCPVNPQRQWQPQERETRRSPEMALVRRRPPSFAERIHVCVARRGGGAAAAERNIRRRRRH
jgi:hypothetical protein